MCDRDVNIIKNLAENAQDELDNKIFKCEDGMNGTSQLKYKWFCYIKFTRKSGKVDSIKAGHVRALYFYHLICY